MHPRGREGLALLAREQRRRQQVLASAPTAPRDLVLAADQFIVRRGSGLRTIIAGYHWFGDWGRDTMIALPGLCLATDRFDDARLILRAFAQNVVADVGVGNVFVQSGRVRVLGDDAIVGPCRGGPGCYSATYYTTLRAEASNIMHIK